MTRAFPVLLLAAYPLIGGAALGLRMAGPDFTAVEALDLLIFLPYVLVGALIASRQPHNAVGWLLLAVAMTSVIGLFLDAYAIYGIITASGTVPLAGAAVWLSSWIRIGTLAGLLFTVLLFPTGRPASPRWGQVTRASALTAAVVGVIFAFGPSTDYRYPQIANPLGVEALRPVWQWVEDTFFVFVALFGLAVLSVASRFRSARGIERQQMKWAVSGFALSAIALAISNVTPAGLNDVLWAFALAVIPAFLGVAILRHRLYDIDVLINRTLVYGALSALLAATYFGAVVLLSALLRPFAAESELAVAGSTLAVVILFAPLRGRIQRLVDERFYRSKYDAARTLDAFSARLRDQVDLDALEREVLAVVGQTVQPAHATLWLRDSRPR